MWVACHLYAGLTSVWDRNGGNHRATRAEAAAQVRRNDDNTMAEDLDTTLQSVRPQHIGTASITPTIAQFIQNSRQQVSSLGNAQPQSGTTMHWPTIARTRVSQAPGPVYHAGAASEQATRSAEANTSVQLRASNLVETAGEQATRTTTGAHAGTGEQVNRRNPATAASEQATRTNEGRLTESYEAK